MKKIFARLAQSELDGSALHTSSSLHQNTHSSSFIGRQFHVGHLSVIVDEVIAEGGFGTVFRVHSTLGKSYALKRTCVNSPQKLAICKREITIVGSLTHKNIIRYVDSTISLLNEDVHEVLMLTAYYPGNLSQILNERHQNQLHLSEAEVVRAFCDLCEAVCRLHHCKTPIIHRDLKIENILIDDHQNFVLCDFGSATSRVLHPGVHGITRCEEEIKKYTTPAYRAPELVDLFKSIPLGPQIDIWAMGCLLYCICFHSLPFGDNPLAIQSGNYFIPDASPYSDSVHKLIGYLLTVNPADRPDIFQASTLAFNLAGIPNPVQNLNCLPVPRWSDLSTPLRDSERKMLKKTTGLPKSNLKSSGPISQLDEVVNTSIISRQRPKASAIVGDIQQSPTKTIQNSSAVASGRADLFAENAVNVQTSWNANFSDSVENASKMLSPTTSSPPSRGHQRTVSVDVAVVSRMSTTNTSTSAVWRISPNQPVNSTSNGIDFTSPEICRDSNPSSWEPFSQCARQSQSLSSLVSPKHSGITSMASTFSHATFNPNAVSFPAASDPSPFNFSPTSPPNASQPNPSADVLEVDDDDDNVAFFAALRKPSKQPV